ncbi:MAG: penicillin-binding protein 2 [Novosphingobium sp.]
MNRKGAGRTVTPIVLTQRFQRRSVVLGALQGGVGVLLAARMGYLAVAENEKYKVASESNRVNLTLVPPRRGWVLDRHGSPLASNRADLRIDLIPDRVVGAERTVRELGRLLALTPVQLQDLEDRMAKAHGFAPVEVASRLDWERFAAVSVRLPDLPGVVPQRGFSRFYPTGPAVGHLIGYVGTVSAEEYERERNPLLITPGFKIGKDGIEKQFEARLRGVPGARRSEVTAGGRIVRDLESRDDVPGRPVQLTIDGPLQDYAARRLGPESGSVVVIDCATGDLLCAASMPSFDPNSFSDGIGRVEWQMLSQDDHVPLRNKVMKGLYPPGSTVKPMVAMSFLEAGLDPHATASCGGGLRVGNRFFHCWNHRGHGTVDMQKGIYQSCDVYFYHFAQKMGMDVIATMAKRLGMQQTFDLPVASQSFGTVPSPAWKMKKYGKEWAIFDTVNATIGQGYMLANPLQLAVMAARLATGNDLHPRLLHASRPPAMRSMGFDPGHIGIIRAAMGEVVNGRGTAHRAKLPIADVLMAGKTGTAQVVGLNVGRGKGGLWKHRDHGLFIFFAPFDQPRYAGAVVIEHGGGSGAAYPIARDVMTFLFDPAKGMDALLKLEAGWGGNAQERMAAKYRSFESALAGRSASPVDDEAVVRSVQGGGDTRPAPATAQTAAAQPAPEPDPPAPSPISAPGT